MFCCIPENIHTLWYFYDTAYKDGILFLLPHEKSFVFINNLFSKILHHDTWNRLKNPKKRVRNDTRTCADVKIRKLAKPSVIAELFEQFDWTLEIRKTNRVNRFYGKITFRNRIWKTDSAVNFLEKYKLTIICCGTLFVNCLNKRNVFLYVIIY